MTIAFHDGRRSTATGSVTITAVVTTCTKKTSMAKAGERKMGDFNGFIWTSRVGFEP